MQTEVNKHFGKWQPQENRRVPFVVGYKIKLRGGALWRFQPLALENVFHYTGNSLQGSDGE